MWGSVKMVAIEDVYTEKSNNGQGASFFSKSTVFSVLIPAITLFI